MTDHSPVDVSADVVAFVGPSLRPDDIEGVVDAACRSGIRLSISPPIRRGDLNSVCEMEARPLVVILDGEFGQNLAVSIYEIRLALRAGLKVHGASSMGALRAVECRTIGMSGSGWVYEQYLNGSIEADADVALLFDPFDFAPLTIPLANLRWLAEQKVRSREILPSCAAQMIEVAKAIPFRERRPEVLSRAWKAQLAPDSFAALAPELLGAARPHWDRKRLDALDALNRAIGSPHLEACRP